MEPTKVNYHSDSGYPWEKEQTKVVSNDQANNNEFKEKAYGHDLRWYLSIFGWPVFTLIILTFLLEIVYRHYFPAWPELAVSGIFLGMRWLNFFFVAVYAFFKIKANLPQVLISSLSGAVISGIVISFFLLLWNGDWWGILNLIALPVLMICESLVITLIIYGLNKLLNK